MSQNMNFHFEAYTLAKESLFLAEFDFSDIDSGHKSNFVKNTNSI